MKTYREVMLADAAWFRKRAEECREIAWTAKAEGSGPDFRCYMDRASDYERRAEEAEQAAEVRE